MSNDVPCSANDGEGGALKRCRGGNKNVMAQRNNWITLNIETENRFWILYNVQYTIHYQESVHMCVCV